MKITLWYLSQNLYGGWATYTSHLARGLKLAGHDVTIRRFTGSVKERELDFGYGVKYKSTPREFAIENLAGTHVVTAVQKNFVGDANRVLKMGAHIVLHDPAELKTGVVQAINRHGSQIIVIRPNNVNLVPGRIAKFVPHPYVRRYTDDDHPTHKWRCISVSRVDFDKNTHILMDANRLGAGIKIFGFENRIYTRFNLSKKYPEWIQSVGHFDRDKDGAVRLCRHATYVVDMSSIKGDGGGTQYTFLEAIDAGSILILNKDWITPTGVMQPHVNCLTVSDGRELFDLLQVNEEHYRCIVNEGRRLLQVHDAKRIAEMFVEAVQ